jgi:hypothetical protein
VAVRLSGPGFARIDDRATLTQADRRALTAGLLRLALFTGDRGASSTEGKMIATPVKRP